MNLLRPLPGLLRRRPAPAGPDEDVLPSVYLSEQPAPDTDRESDWCVWPDEVDPAGQRLRDSATAEARGEDPWAVPHAQRHGTTDGATAAGQAGDR